MVSDEAWPGTDQRPWGNTPAAGPVGRPGCPSASRLCGVVCCYPSLGRPRSACVCGVLGLLALVHRCARLLFCVRCYWPLGTYSQVCAARVQYERRPCPLGACSPVCVLGVLCVRCPWPLGACSPVCVLVVCFVQCLCPLGGCSLVCLLDVLRVQCPCALATCAPMCVLGLSCVSIGVLRTLHWVYTRANCRIPATSKCPELRISDLVQILHTYCIQKYPEIIHNNTMNEISPCISVLSHYIISTPIAHEPILDKGSPSWGCTRHSPRQAHAAATRALARGDTNLRACTATTVHRNC